MNITILYNPDCSKSRAVLKIVQSRGAEAILRNYLTSPLDEKEIIDLLNKEKILFNEINTYESDLEDVFLDLIKNNIS